MYLKREQSQLRANIIHEIQTHATETEHSKSLLLKALDSLIIDYLQSQGNDFTLSVFLPESGMGALSRVILAY